MAMAFASHWTPASPSPIDNIGWDGYTYSEWLTGSVISTPGAVMRLKMKAGSVGHNIVKMYVGSALAATPFTFTGDQVQVTFNGNAGLTVPANEDMVTDAFTTPDISGTRKLLIRVYSTGASNTSYTETGGAGGDAGNVGRCWNIADTAADTSIATTSGSSPHNIIFQVDTAAVIPSKSCVTDSNWRIVFDNPGLVNPTRIKYSEIHLVGTRLEKKTGATVSGNGFTDSTTASQIDDGNTAQSIHMGYGPEISGVTYGRFDFSSGQTVSGIKIISSNDTDGTAVSKAPVNFRLQFLQGSTWVTYLQVVGATWTKAKQAQTFYRDGSVNDGGGTGTIGPPTLAPAKIPVNDSFFAEAPTAAWGLRRLVGTYGGLLLQIRDTVSGAIIDVPQLFDGSCDTSGLTSTYAVVKIYDQTGQGSDLTQATTGMQPAFLIAGSAIGTPTILFDGVDDYMYDVNALRTNAPYMSPRPSLFWVGGPGLDGLGTYIGNRPIAYVDSNGLSSGPNFQPISMQWNTPGGSNRIIAGSAGAQVNFNVSNALNLTGFKGWGGVAILGGVPSGGAACVFDTFTAHGAQTALAVTTNALYPNPTRITFYAEANGTNPWKGHFLEAYMYDGNFAETTDAINDFFTARAEDILLPKTLWEMTIHSSFAQTGPGSVQSGAAEIIIAETTGGATEALQSRVTIANGTSSASISAFDGILTSSSGTFTANASVDFILTWRPTFYQTNAARELRIIAPFAVSAVPSNRIPKTFGLRRSIDNGVTWVSFGEFDATSQGSPTDGKVYTYAIGEIHNDFTFDYKLNYFSVDFTFDYKFALKTDFTFDYKIALGKSFAFDYKIALTKDFAFDYKIALGKSFSFDYAIEARVNVDFIFDYHLSSHIDIDVTFDFKILEPFNADFVFDFKIFNINTVTDFVFDYLFTPTAHADFTFDYALSTIVGIRADFTFDYQLLPTFSLVDLPGLRMPPETPVGEIIGYVTNVISAYDGTEQRASLAQFAYANVTFKYVILNDSDRRAFMADFMAVSRGVCLVPQWQYGTNIAAAAEAAESVSYDPTTTDIRSGDYLYYLTPQGLTGFFGQALNVNPTGAVVAPLLTALPNGSWIMPARKMHWSDGQGVQMQSIAGEASVAMSGLGLRSPMREGQVAGLVPTFDGLPLLDKRPLAPADDLFTGGDLVLALSADLPTEIFSPARMSVVSGSRAFTAGRGQGLDFWREFANATAGAKKPFLAPSFRADLVPVSVSGDLLRVAGEDYLPLAGLPAYSRLAIETASGVTNYKIIGAEALDGDTIIQTSVAVTGTIKKISYLNQFRLLNDTINLTHDVMNVKVGFAVRTTNE